MTAARLKNRKAHRSFWKPGEAMSVIIREVSGLTRDKPDISIQQKKPENSQPETDGDREERITGKGAFPSVR